MPADWYYRAGAREIGPLSFHDLASIARQGRLDLETDVRHGRGGDWIAAGRVPGLIGAGAAGLSRSTPPPLPSASDSLFDAIGRAGSTAGGRKADSSGNTSVTVGLLCLAAGGVVAVLFAVVIFAVGLGSGSRHSAAERRGGGQATLAPIAGDAASDTLPTAVAARRRASSTASNWMERIDENSHDSVVVVVNTQTGSEGMVSEGTAFVIAADGDRKLLLTNKHVMRIGDDPETDPLARQCYLKTVSGTVMRAKLAGEARDPSVDLALLVVESRALRPLGPVKRFADIHVGENLVSVGNPGIPGTGVILEGTVTPGIVSGKREELLIQTTAPINHGNSGGPLVNETGQVLGVNTFYAKDMQATNFAFRADWVLGKQHWRYYQEISRLMAAIGRP